MLRHINDLCSKPLPTMAEEHKSNGQLAPLGDSKSRQAAKELYPMSDWKYDAFLHTFSVLVDLFFREVHPRGAWRVPRSGPVLFIAAPHANQVNYKLDNYRYLGFPQSTNPYSLPSSSMP